MAAAAGAKVAKHGNRAASGNTGSADLLTAAGLCIELEPEQVAEVLRRHGFAFMFAPLHHPAMKHVGPIRMELGVRTVFNLAGPLSNPAGAKRQVAGVFAGKWLRPLAEALAELGGERALVVHSDDGLDEISIAAPTSVAELKEDGSIEEYRVRPEDFGLEASGGLDEIKAADPAASWHQVQAVFAGSAGPGARCRPPQHGRHPLCRRPGGEPERGGGTGRSRPRRGRGHAPCQRPGGNDHCPEKRLVADSQPPDRLGYLGRIIEARARDFAEARKDMPLSQLRRDALSKPAPRGFRAALEAHIESQGIAIIAEIKKASPSRGLISPRFDPAATAAAYERGGAAALSVLTEERSFLGCADHLRQARDACNLPALRKDFVLDDWSLCQSRFLEADCAL